MRQLEALTIVNARGKDNNEKSHHCQVQVFSDGNYAPLSQVYKVTPEAVREAIKARLRDEKKARQRIELKLEEIRRKEDFSISLLKLCTKNRNEIAMERRKS